MTKNIILKTGDLMNSRNNLVCEIAEYVVSVFEKLAC